MRRCPTRAHWRTRAGSARQPRIAASRPGSMWFAAPSCTPPWRTTWASRRPPEPPRSRRGVSSLGEAAHAQVFDVDVLVDAVARAFAPETGLLDAAEGCDRSADQPGIDAYHPALERARHAPHAADVTRIEVGGQSEFGVVGQPDRLGLVPEAEQRRDRTKDLLLREAHAGIDVGQYRGFVEGAPQRMPAAADQGLRARSHRLPDQLLHLGEGRLVDQRSLLDAAVHAVADLELRDGL